MRSISFSSNWNNKLLLNVFPTFRLENPTKYVVGQAYEVYLRGKLLGTAELINARAYAYPLIPGTMGTNMQGRKLANLNEAQALLDTGKPLAYLLKLLRTLYPKVNWNLTALGWYYFKYTSTTKELEKLQEKRQAVLHQPDLFQPQTTA